MPTDDFFRARLDQMIDLRHPLAVFVNQRAKLTRVLGETALKVSTLDC